MRLMHPPSAKPAKRSNPSGPTVCVVLVKVAGLNLARLPQGKGEHISIRNADPWTNFILYFFLNPLAFGNVERKPCSRVSCDVFSYHLKPSTPAQQFVTNEPMAVACVFVSEVL